DLSFVLSVFSFEFAFSCFTLSGFISADLSFVLSVFSFEFAFSGFMSADLSFVLSVFSFEFAFSCLTLSGFMSADLSFVLSVFSFEFAFSGFMSADLSFVLSVFCDLALSVLSLLSDLTVKEFLSLLELAAVLVVVVSLPAVSVSALVTA